MIQKIMHGGRSYIKKTSKNNSDLETCGKCCFNLQRVDHTCPIISIDPASLILIGSALDCRNIYYEDVTFIARLEDLLA
jgi:hypothetical protein